MKNDYLKFLKVLCSLYDGENYVPESKIRSEWPDCPSHNAILGFGKDIYFEWNCDVSNPGYIPTVHAISLVDESKRSKRSMILNIITLVVAVLTLAATILIPILQHFLEQ